MAGHLVEHRRYAEHEGDPVPFDQFEGGRRVEVLDQDTGAALEQHRQREHVQPGRVEQRGGDQGAFVGDQVGVDEDVERVPGQIAVREHRALGTAGRARGVHDDAGVVGGDGLVDRFTGGSVDQLLVAGAHFDVRPDVRAAGQTGDESGRRRRVHQGLGSRVAQLVGDLGSGEAGVERDEDRAERAGREEGLEVRRVVRAQVGDPVAAAQAERAQGLGEAGGALVQLRVADFGVPVDQGGAVGGLAGPACGPRPQSLVAHRRAPLRVTDGS